MDLSGFDRDRWILYFEILPRVALTEPAPVSKVYELIVRERERLNISISYSRLIELLREFERRGIVKLLNSDNELQVVLTDKARYYVLIYSVALSNL